ncbi:nucleoside diphosphate kinase A isoform X2 [Gavia stellata]|uniref:nucleoside diphosphate kinase A isoform X2 n=1 Tax=Gavia stellata TaxID=37040 RepID=UPI0028A283AA|nr:nucleoside diphosphate kinase A isoform X2 [Gavia stellata]
MKLLQADQGLLDKHYQQLRQKPFYPALLAYMTSGPLVAMVWEGYNVVRSTRAMVGDTDSAAAAAGTIRGDFSMHVSRSRALLERTFVAIKPDGVQRHLVGEIIRRFERKGLQLVGLKLLQASEELLKEHYIALRDRPFYSRLVKYMSSGPVVAMVWQGLDVVKTVRTMIGETNPAESRPGTIRGDFCVEVSKNVIHGSDSVESARQEISLWFRAEELTCWEDTAEHWIYA